LSNVTFDSLIKLSAFLKQAKSDLNYASVADLFRALNCDDDSFKKSDLDNLMRTTPSLDRDKALAVLKRIGNLPWQGNPHLDGLYKALVEPLAQPDGFNGAIQRYLDPGQAEQFHPDLLGSYLVYRAAGDGDGVARALLRIHAISGRTGMQYTFTRLHGPKAGYKAKGRVITQKRRFMFLGYSVDPDGTNEGGLTLMAMSPPDSRNVIRSGPYTYLHGLHLMVVNFTDHQAAAMRLVAVRNDDLSSQPSGDVIRNFGGIISFADAARDISDKTGYHADEFYKADTNNGLLVNVPTAGGVLTYSDNMPRKKR
jgi:hypothetical protein